MYIITADYHTHTRYSHGKGTIEENVQAARRRGLKKIAITDHGFRHFGFGMSIRDIEKMRQEIKLLNQKYSDIQVIMGVESNLIGLDGEIDIPEDYMDKFDIILMGFHRAVLPKTLKDGWQLFARNGLQTLFHCKGEGLRIQNTHTMIRAMERYPIKIITHPGAKIDIDSKLLAYHAAKHGVALEINASHGFMNVEYVKIAMGEGASFVINSDAHTPEKVGVFGNGIRIAEAAGLKAENIINASII